jgi:hypothetical protein
MSKTKIFLSILMLLVTASMFASQMWVVGEVFTQTW